MILETKTKAAEEEPEPKPSKAKTKRKVYPLELHENLLTKLKVMKKIEMSKYLKNIFFIKLHYF